MLNYDYNEVEITRRLYRQGNEAEYLLNRQQCRLKDITDLLLDTDLEEIRFLLFLKEIFLILLIVVLKKDELFLKKLQEFLKYKKRKIEAIRKLERTTDNLNRIKDIVYELEKQIAPLKKQKEKAEVFLTLEGKTYFNRSKCTCS